MEAERRENKGMSRGRSHKMPPAEVGPGLQRRVCIEANKTRLVFGGASRGIDAVRRFVLSRGRSTAARRPSTDERTMNPEVSPSSG